MNIADVTPAMMDAAIRWQMAKPQPNRANFAERLAGSEQFVEYAAFCLAALAEGQDVRSVICGALSVGIEIGMALEEMQRRPQA